MFTETWKPALYHQIQNGKYNWKLNCIKVDFYIIYVWQFVLILTLAVHIV